MSWIYDIKISKKIILIVLVGVLFSLTIGGIGLYFMKEMDKASQRLYHDQLLPIQWLNETRALNLMNDKYLLEIINEPDLNKQKEIKQRLDENVKQSNELFAQYQEKTLSEQEQAIVKVLVDIIPKNREARDHAIQLAMEGNRQGAIDAYRANLNNSVTNTLLRRELGKYREAQANQIQQRVEADFSRSIYTMLGAILLSTVVSFGLGAWMARLISKPVVDMERLMAKAGSGDLTVFGDVQGMDEIGDLTASFNKMVKSQAAMVEHARKAADELAAGSEETAASAAEVSVAVQEVAQNMQNVAEKSERGTEAVLESSEVLLELSSLIQMAKEKAKQASATSHATMDTAEIGKETVKQTVRRMENINQKAEETGKLMNQLVQFSQEIGVITETITNLANQTNLLALNAAIEAARAGEAGRGFAVVAEEVRKLADQSSQGAAEVSALVQKISASTQATVQATNESRKEVEEGVRVVSEAGKALDNILLAVQETEQAIQGIVKLTEDEVASSDRIVSLINTLATVIDSLAIHVQQVAASTEETTASVETIAASAEESSAMAQELRNLVELFNVDSSSKNWSNEEHLIKAKSDHLLWKVRIVNMINGTEMVRPEDVNTHRECALGKWYFDGNNSFKDDKDFIAIDEPHQKVHEYALKAAQAYQVGNHDEARRMLKQLEANSKRVISMINKLMKKV
ncbi:HAMP domain-containing protein [Heliobacillus mobilis]|uniref:HAMP domain-containing protein n=1 Tax=Heliobacterium mobile TaxID=28064 RepID=A0A6I3SI88_HELMO|nr:methyl-accepting chemotaxis protein [Heliobacterium mobile]MTV48526.1 HAMP domain-containing protein [Heliobacterium mobile]